MSKVKMSLENARGLWHLSLSLSLSILPSCPWHSAQLWPGRGAQVLLFQPG